MDDKGGTMARESIGRFTKLIGDILRSEQLDELPETTLVPERTSFVSRLLEAESLPLDEASPGGGRNLPRASGLLASEPLPFDDRPAPRSSPRASGLFASESLPFDDRPGPRDGRPSFMATLFSRESLPLDPVPGPGPVRRGHGG
jgi:hypothetical protein